jgi:hypothetical protein
MYCPSVGRSRSSAAIMTCKVAPVLAAREAAVSAARRELSLPSTPTRMILGMGFSVPSSTE